MDYKSLSRLFGNIAKEEAPAISQVGKRLSKKETEITKDLLREHPDLIPDYARHQAKMRKAEVKGSMDVPEVEPVGKKEISSFAEDTSPGLSTNLSGDEIVHPKQSSQILSSESIEQVKPQGFELVGKPYTPAPPKTPNLPIQSSPRSLVSTAGEIVDGVPYKDVTPKAPGAQSTAYKAGNSVGNIAKWIKENPKKALAMGFTGALAGSAAMSDGEFSAENPSVVPENTKVAPKETEANLEDPSKEQSLTRSPAQSKEISKASKVPSLSPSEVTAKGPLLSTINFGDKTEGSVDQLRALQERANVERMVAGFGQAGDMIGSAFAGTKPQFQEMWKDQRDQAGQPIKDFAQRQEQEKNDPNSAISQGYREMMKKFGINIEGQASAAAIEKIAPGLQKLYEAEENRKQRSEDNKYRYDQLAAMTKMKRDDRDMLRDENQKVKRERQQEIDEQKFSKDVAGVQDLIMSLDEVEKELGFRLEDADTSNSKLKVKGKTKDLPGVSLPGLGRVSVHSDDAQRLQSAAARVFNSVLKDRSGAAITNTELERLKTEFGEGKFNKEHQMIDALQRFKRLTAEELKNREAGYNPEVVETYADRGGRTSKTIAPSLDIVKVQAPDGTIRRVPKDKVNAAVKAGGKIVE